MYPANKTVLILGDCNLPDIDWSVDYCLKCNNFSSPGVILSLFYEHGLEQLITQPTGTKTF